MTHFSPPKKLLSNSSFSWCDAMLWLSLYPCHAQDAEALNNICLFLSPPGWPDFRGVQVGLSNRTHCPANDGGMDGSLIRRIKISINDNIKIFSSSGEVSPEKARNGRLFYVYTQKTTTTLITATNCWVSSTSVVACGRRKKRALFSQEDLDFEIDPARSV